MQFGPLAYFFFLSVLTPGRAQTSKIFQWQFTADNSSLLSCQSSSITVKPFNSGSTTSGTGVPPFYMLAFPVGGTPSITLIGADTDNLSWTVNQPVGTQLVLEVVDSQGSSGGVPSDLFTVTAGQTTACIPPPSTAPAFTVVANVSDALTTCQPWGLTIAGGVPPYSLTLASLNSSIGTNVTMGPNDDAFTFIDRVAPGTQLIAAVSDSTGRWASGTPIVKTQGSTNTQCIGLVSSSGNSTQIKAAQPSSSSASAQPSAAQTTAAETTATQATAAQTTTPKTDAATSAYRMHRAVIAGFLLLLFTPI